MTDVLFKTDIAPDIDAEQLAERLHIGANRALRARCRELLAATRELIRPAYAARRLPVGETTQSGIMVARQELRSRIVAHQLQGRDTVWAYIATAGRAIADYVQKTPAPLDQYILDQIACLACLQAADGMAADIAPLLDGGHQIRLCPGSVPDWDVAELSKLFLLLDGDYQRLGVRLLASGLIDPLKSMCGLLLPAAEDFASCEICDRARCSERSAPFDGEKYHRMMNL